MSLDSNAALLMLLPDQNFTGAGTKVQAAFPRTSKRTMGAVAAGSPKPPRRLLLSAALWLPLAHFLRAADLDRLS